MGPGFVHPGNSPFVRSVVVSPAASMGPGFVHPGNKAIQEALAALRGASMGPGFVHPGNSVEHGPLKQCYKSFNGARVCTPGKSGAGPNLSPIRRIASMGPGFVHPGNPHGPRAARPHHRFNGARVCTPGKYARFERYSDIQGASMGPGFVHPGNLRRVARMHRIAPLQWGPGLYTREISLPATAPPWRK